MPLVETEMGLQAHTGGAPANREHRQPVNPRAAGRNAFVLPEPAATPEARRWEDAFVTAAVAARFLCYKDFRDLKRYVRAGLLNEYHRPLSNRPLYKRTELEALLKPKGVAA